MGRNKLLDSATKKFDAFMLSRGFKRDHADRCLCTKRDVVGNSNILVPYEDDMLMARKKESALHTILDQLNSGFAMKDLSPAEQIIDK